MCGFSARTVAALQALNAPFAAVDILPDPRIRQELSALSQWPTIPQLFVNGELVGGCDIVTEMYESGELAETLGVEQPARAPSPPRSPPWARARWASRTACRKPARGGRPALPWRGARTAREVRRPRGRADDDRRPRRGQAVLWIVARPAGRAHRELHRAAAGRRVDPAAVDRAGAHQHAAVGRGVVRRDRPCRGLASPRRDHRPGPAGAAHPAGRQPARHRARGAARCIGAIGMVALALWAILPRWQSVVPGPLRGLVVAARDAPGVREAAAIFGGYERWRALHRTTGLFVAAGFVHGVLDGTPFDDAPVLRWSYVAIGAIGLGVLRLPRAAGALLPVAARLPGADACARSTRAWSRSRWPDRPRTWSSCPASSP